MSVSNIQDQLLAQFQKINLNGQKDTFFGKRKLSAITSFKNLGLPTIKNEDWKYANLKGLSNHEYDFNKKSEISDTEIYSLDFSKIAGLKITFINGVFNEKHSSLSHNQNTIKVLSLKQALKDCPELLDQHLGKYVNYEVDGVIASNAALNEDGSVIFIGNNTTASQPIIINSIFDTKSSNVASFGHHLVVVGENSEAKIVEISTTIGEKSSFNNTLTELIVGKSSRVDYYKIQNENDASYHLGTTQVIQKDHSYFYSATITVNGGFVRNNLNLVLDGQHIDNHMYGLYIPNGSQFVDNHTIVDHKLPNCQSNELYKGVLMDKSTGVFNGKIFVREDAQKTNAYQNCRNVITSDSATMNSKPQLEIWADDVKCSHGTTTGKLNDEAIFYMQSRGIPKAEAIKLQLIAFAEDVVSQIKIEEIKEILEGLIEAKLS